MIVRITGLLIALALAYAAGQTVWHGITRAPTGVAQVATPALEAASAPSAPPKRRLADLWLAAPRAPETVAPPPCAAASAFTSAAATNAASLRTAPWSVMGRPETGWAIYAPLVAREIATACGPAETGFAAALAAWQGAHGLPANGLMDPPTLKAMNLVWLRRRPFVAASAQGACPPPPPPQTLVWAAPGEGYLTKPIQLRPGALAAYRQMVAAARQDVPAMADDKRLLTIFSGYRDPADDAARCAQVGDCGTIARAHCSAHRTGLAMDLFVGAAPGFVPESTADANRLYQSRTPVYGWMVANAARFGFINYPFEPWHWEWTGEAP